LAGLYAKTIIKGLKMDDYRVTEEAKFEYREQGVTVLRNVISQVWLDQLDAAIERDSVSP